MEFMGTPLGFLAQRKHLLLLLLYPLVGLGFTYCESAVPVAQYVMEWPGVDQAIPFVPWMAWPYVFWYAAVAFPFFWLGWRDGPAFSRYCWFIYLGMTSSYVVYLLFPNGQLLRPALDSLGTGWDAEILRWIYSHDTPRNVNPSIHVIDTMAVWFALARDRTLGPKRWFQTVLSLTCLAIISSTVLVKQHSILDVFGGLVSAGVWYTVLYSPISLCFSIRSR
jgi:membrane-associated phospholipid phosphatase